MGIALFPIFHFWQFAYIPFFHFPARPGSLAKKLQAGIDRGIEHEAADLNSVGQCLPAMTGDQSFENRLQVDAVKRIVRMGIGIGHKTYRLPSVIHDFGRIVF